MSMTVVTVLFGASSFAAIMLLFYGQIFGLVAVPTVTEKRGWKYALLIAAMLVPFFGAIVCLAHYRKTAYASNFILLGLGFAAVAAGLLVYMISAPR